MFDVSNSHYEWLRKHLPSFLRALGMPYPEDTSLMSAHGDKGYSYKGKWNNAGIPFVHGMALFLISYESPYRSEVRDTDKGWVDVSDWVINNYERFRPYLSTDDLECWKGRD